MTTKAVVAWLALAGCATGCSLMTTNRLSAGYRPETSPRCSASIMPPVGDLLIGSVELLAAGKAVEEERAQPPEARTWDDALVPAAMAAVFVASAIYGWHQLERCEDAREAHERWIEEHGLRRGRVAMLEGGGDAR